MARIRLDGNSDVTLRTTLRLSVRRDSPSSAIAPLTDKSPYIHSAVPAFSFFHARRITKFQLLTMLPGNCGVARGLKTKRAGRAVVPQFTSWIEPLDKGSFFSGRTAKHIRFFPILSTTHHVRHDFALPHGRDSLARQL
jgi:hypothetical protein